ncbi:MAG: isochorismatase family protein [Bradymonadales bacterium]|jgi:nicotinamidase-related amidase
MRPYFEDCALLVIDMQEKLLAAMEPEIVEQSLKNAEMLIELATDFGLSIFYTEQYPKGLGATHERLREKLKDALYVEKLSFSCLDEPDFCERIAPHIPQSLIVVGIESHVCVLNTVLDLIIEDEEEELEIFVPVDAIASRRKTHWKNAISQMSNLGVIMTNTETLIFQALGEAKGDLFKKYSKMLK